MIERFSEQEQFNIAYNYLKDKPKELILSIAVISMLDLNLEFGYMKPQDYEEEMVKRFNEIKL